MKTHISFAFILSILFSFTAEAQKTVVLSIDHLLEGEAFSLNTTKSSNVSDNYEVTRLEYYLSEFKLMHDGGQLINLPDTWLLVNAAQGTEVVLGDFMIQDLEEIQFSNGIDSDYNHLDPALYPSGHPLALGNPSMHWGWTAGYRFLALEGNVGPNFAYRFEVHALGDRNFRDIALTTTGRESSDTIYIELEASCEAIFREIDITSGVIAHGELGDAQQALINMEQHVFRAINDPNSTRDLELSENIDVMYANHKIQLSRTDANTEVEFRLYNLLGQEIESGEFMNSKTLNVNQNGIYLLTFVQNNETISTAKVLVH